MRSRTPHLSSSQRTKGTRIKIKCLKQLYYKSMLLNLQRISISGSAMKYTHLAGIQSNYFVLCHLVDSILSQEIRHRTATPLWGMPS